MFAFTIDELYGMYATYNSMLGVGQLVAWGLMFGFVGAAYAEKKKWNKWISLLLGSLWIWVGVVYHWLFFSAINPSAKYFAAGFVLQGLLFLYEGIKEENLWFGYRGGFCAMTGKLFLLYAMVIYPVWGIWQGRGFPEVPALVLAPVPVAIYSFGLLLWTYKRVPEYLLIIPIVWSLVGTSVAALGIYQDFGLLAAGLISAVMIHRHNKQMKRNI